MSLPIPWIRLFASLLIASSGSSSFAQSSGDVPPGRSPLQVLMVRYCVQCHNDQERAADLSLDAAARGSMDEKQDLALFEQVARKLRTRQMPPIDAERPTERAYRRVLADLEEWLDRKAANRPNPGRTGTFRRLSRIEYQNTIRDLLALEMDAADLLPPDESTHGFDSASGDLSPTLLDRYITAAETISRRALGRPQPQPASDTIRMRPDVTQEEHVPGLPLGTRGGMVVPYHFPQDGEYEVQVRLARDRNEEVEGLAEPHELELLLDRRLVQAFTVRPPPDRKDFHAVDQHIKARFSVRAGSHQLGVTFVKNPTALVETRRQPYHARFNMHRHPRLSPAVYQVTITGPFEGSGGDTPSRRRIFSTFPSASESEEAAARKLLAPLMRRAFRRSVVETDFDTPLQLFRAAREQGDFESAMELALSAILVNPHFLFRIERDPLESASGSVYRISDFELATRLSYFLWSSMPDDELLDLASQHRLSQPEELNRQVRRMLADPRSHTLASNFASQWLHLRNLDSITPDLRLFPDFDDNLRQSLREETERLFESVMRDDRSVLDLLRSDHTFLNERLAKHYGIPHVYGSRFRLVATEENERGGLLRHGSVHTVTSYPTRTSPVIRGKWVLENLLGTPPPPPPENVPALKDNTVSSALPLRERLAEHRSNAACSSCHNLMDPAGFALENFDAVGRFRRMEAGKPIDVTGGLPDGREFTGVGGLEQALQERPELFVTTMTEKLLTYALGRGIEYFDGPAVRKIVRDAGTENYRFSDLILGVVSSVPFQMRSCE